MERDVIRTIAGSGSIDHKSECRRRRPPRDRQPGPCRWWRSARSKAVVRDVNHRREVRVEEQRLDGRPFEAKERADRRPGACIAPCRSDPGAGCLEDPSLDAGAREQSRRPARPREQAPVDAHGRRRERRRPATRRRLAGGCAHDAQPQPRLDPPVAGAAPAGVRRQADHDAGGRARDHGDVGAEVQRACGRAIHEDESRRLRRRRRRGDRHRGGDRYERGCRRRRVARFGRSGRRGGWRRSGGRGREQRSRVHRERHHERQRVDRLGARGHVHLARCADARPHVHHEAPCHPGPRIDANFERARRPRLDERDLRRARTGLGLEGRLVGAALEGSILEVNRLVVRGAGQRRREREPGNGGREDVARMRVESSSIGARASRTSFGVLRRLCAVTQAGQGAVAAQGGHDVEEAGAGCLARQGDARGLGDVLHREAGAR